MIKIENKSKTQDYVYDISLDGTVVNALGMNVCSNTDGFNFQLPDNDKFRYTKDNPYIGLGLNREVEKGKEYTGFKADVAEFNDTYMRDMHYSENGINKMGLGIDEIVDATINFSRKNYADYFPTKPYPEDVKMVGNTIKSKKMPEYISKFLTKGVRLLLQNKGQEFLTEYYNYVEKIYNYQIPLIDIATKGKVKKSIKEYIEDCKVLTKAGRPKSRQAWMELVINEGITVDVGETLYYVNIGKTKSQSDVKKVTKYYTYEDGDKKYVTAVLEKEFKNYKKENPKQKYTTATYIAEFHPEVSKEEEIILNCKLIPKEAIENENGYYSEDIEYNTSKYIDMFNKRITPLLVCFSRTIRDKILITNPKDRCYFTEEECRLCSGEPNKIGDQDTYEQLMTMEDKEIKFWSTNGLVPPFLDACGMGKWEDIVDDYTARMEEEERVGIAAEKNAFFDIINEMTKDEIEAFKNDNEVPASILKICDLDPETLDFISKRFDKVKIGHIRDIIENVENAKLFNEIE